MTMRSLRLRLIVLAIVWTTVAIIVAGFVISSLLRNFVEHTFDEALSATMVAVMAGTEFDQAGNLVISNSVVDPRFDQPLSGWYWQLNNAQEVLSRSRSLWDVDLGLAVAEPDGTITTQEVGGPGGEMIRRMARDFTVPGGTQRLRVIVAMPVAVIDEEVASVVEPLIVSLLLLATGLSLAIALQVHFGLAPLQRLGRYLAEVRRGDRERIPPQTYSEIRPIAKELNALLDHNQSVIARARTHVGNLAHGLKTPLAVLENEIAARNEGCNGRLAEVSATMNRLIRHHLRRARSAAAHGILGARTPVRATLDDLLPVFKGVYADRAISISVTSLGDAFFAGDRQDLEEMLGNLIDNACKWAASTVVIHATNSANSVEISVSDDGPGMSKAQIDAARSRGVRLDEAKPGSGLGLAIVDDLVQLYQGQLSLTAGASGGLDAHLTLPRVN
ncbi:ATP-binding protein [Pararhizobium haloflavum]|uniref:ATP-binding protein n=1 Tax=Pararhizobium haloflavum TaxID=2037914 RepID=UPI000C17E250|nr:ATP-binding protein [Pararhizobium haloflavum]